MPEKLKKGWTRVAFGDVVRQVKDRVNPEVSNLERYVAGEHMDTDDLKIRRWGLIGDGYLGPAFHMRFKPGHVLYGSRRTYLRKVAVADFEGITANTTYVIESKDPKVLLPELLPFIMQTESFHDHSIKQSKGSVNPYINFSDLTWYEFALPPLDEQRRIAEVFAYHSNHREAFCKAETQAVLARESYARCLWEELQPVQLKPLAEVCLKVQDGTHFSPKSKSGEYRYVTSKNIRDGFLDLRDAGWITKEEHDGIFRKCDVRFGDVLLTKDGANAGSVAINDIQEPFSLLSSVAIIRPNPDVLLGRYVFEYLRNRIGRDRVLSQVKGSAITRLVLAQIRGLKIPVPSLDVQHRCCEFFCGIERALSAIRRRTMVASEIRHRITERLENGV